MNLLKTIKDLFVPLPKGNGATGNNKQSAANGDNFLNTMQRICSHLPEGRMFVEIKNGEFNISLSWNAEGKVQEPIVFEVNGQNDEVAFFEEVKEENLEEVREVKDVCGVAEAADVPSVPSVLSVLPSPSLLEDQKAERQEARRRKRQCDMMADLEAHLAAHYDFRYNLLTEQTECAALDGGERVYRPLDSRLLNTVTYGIVREGINCWDKDVRRIVESSLVREYHPFSLYFETLPVWDGIDRVSALARRVSSEEWWVSGFSLWMRALVAQWTGRDAGVRANSVAPIIISKRQGLGKSTFCRQLLPPELRRYFTESYDLSAIGAAEEKLATFGLISLDEFDKLPVRKMPLLKNLLQMESLNIRKAYRRSAAPLHRVASFIGTSNRRDLLTDTTGSRRFLCVETDHEIDCSPVDYAQLYAQLKHELEGGARHWFTKEEEADIQRRNAAYYRGSAEEEVFSRMFRPCRPEDSGAAFLSATEIYELMCREHRRAMRGVSLHALSRLLPSLAPRVHTKYRNGYWVVRV